jgi:hypothetical protein
MRPELVLEGVIPANPITFDSDKRIDEKNYRRHLRYPVNTKAWPASPPTLTPLWWRRSPSRNSSSAWTSPSTRRWAGYP